MDEARLRVTGVSWDEFMASLVQYAEAGVPPMILVNRPDLDPAALRRTRELICAAVPGCLIEEWEPMVEGLDLPDPDDRHILAAAIRAGAQVIVTANVKDFPAAALETFNIEAQHPDVFVLGLIDLDHGAVVTVVHQQQKDLVRKP